MRPPELDRIQRWMQSAIVAGGEPSARGARQRILPSATMSPEERLGVYRGMYVARLNEVLRADYPAVAELLGDELFDEMAQMYVREHPSRSYTLNDFGAALPGFLKRLEGLPSAGYAHDLASFEFAQASVFDERETPPLTREAIAAVAEQDWPRARLEPVAALRILDMAYPVQEFIRARNRAAEGTRPARRRRRTRLAVYRRNYSVTWIELSAAGHAVLLALAGGRTLGEAVAGVRDPAAVFSMFQEWMTEGLFQSVTI